MKPAIEAAQQLIVAEFAAKGDWWNRYSYLIELAKTLPPMPAEYKTPNNLIEGCQNDVWIYGICRNGTMHYWGYSQSVIASGILVLLLRILNGRTPDEIKESRLTVLDRTGITSNLSPYLNQGIKRILSRLVELSF